MRRLHGPDRRTGVAGVPGWQLLLVLLCAAGAARTLVSDWRWVALGNPLPQGDTAVYIGAIENQAAGDPLYVGLETGEPVFTYPPFAAIALRPLTWVDARTAGLVWLGVCLAVAVAIVAVVAVTRGAVRSPGSRSVVFFAGIGAFAGSVQVQSDLINGQVNLVLALLLIADVGRLIPDRWRGTLVGVAAALKLTPLAVIPWFLLTRQWTALRNSLAAFAGCTALAWVVLPEDSVTFWTEAIRATDRVGDVHVRFNASVMGTLARAGLSGSVLTVSWLLLGGLVVLAAYWRAQQQRQRGDDVAAMVVLGCAAVIATPLAWVHHQLWLPLAGLVLVTRPATRARVAGVAILGLAFFHAPITRWYDANGMSWLFNLDFVMILLVCVLGLSSDRATSGSDLGSASGGQPSPRPPSDRRSP